MDLALVVLASKEIVTKDGISNFGFYGITGSAKKHEINWILSRFGFDVVFEY